MDIAVVGAGSMGSLIGGLLAADGAEVTLLNRSAPHVEAIAERGLALIDETGPDRSERVVQVPATTDPAEIGEVDLVILLVKSYATAAAMAEATPLLGSGTDVLTLQNGLGNAETIAEYVPEARVLAGVTTHGAIREAPGRVRHTGTGDTAIGRYFDGGSAAREAGADERTRAIADRFTAAGLATDVVDDVQTHLWEKVLVNVGINAPTALARVPNGALVADDAGGRVLERAVREAERVARANGHDVRDDAVEYARSVAERTASNASSMRQDVEAGRRTEVEALYGAVVERAEATGLSVPVCRTLADLVRLAERDARRATE